MEDYSIIGRNTERYRLLSGLTAKDMCESAGLSEKAWRKLKEGNTKPRTRTLSALAKALKVSTFDLLRPIPQLGTLQLRCDAPEGVKEEAMRDQLIMDISRKVSYCKELESMLGQERQVTLDVFRKAFTKDNDPKKLAALVRKHYGLHELEPVADMANLLEFFGVLILPVKSKFSNFFGACLSEDDNGPAVCVKIAASKGQRSPTVERQISTAAHELGHLLMHLNYCPGNTENVQQEEQADDFMAELITPVKAVKYMFEECKGLHLVDQVLHVKSFFNVSYRMILHRLSEIHSVDYQKLKYAFLTMYKERYGKLLTDKDEPMALQLSCFEEDQLQALVREALDKELITRSKAAEILGLSLKEVNSLMASWSVLCPS